MVTDERGRSLKPLHRRPVSACYIDKMDHLKNHSLDIFYDNTRTLRLKEFRSFETHLSSPEDKDFAYQIFS